LLISFSTSISLPLNIVIFIVEMIPARAPYRNRNLRRFTAASLIEAHERSIDFVDSLRLPALVAALSRIRYAANKVALKRNFDSVKATSRATGLF
jgi:hypothetical protein